MGECFKKLKKSRKAKKKFYISNLLEKEVSWCKWAFAVVTQVHKTGKLQNSSFHCRQKVSLAGNRFTIFCVVMFQICKESQKMSKIVVDVVSCVQQCCKVLKESHLLRSTDISTSAICQLGDFYITSSELQFSMMLFFKKFYTSFTSGLLYWHLVLIWYLHQPDSHQLSLQRTLSRKDRQLDRRYTWVR